MNSQEIISNIENHYKVSLPETYKNWIELGYMDGENYLYVFDAEWLEFDEITTVLEERFDFLKITRNLIPFAKTPGIEYWCFDIEDGFIRRILFCDPIENDAKINAPDFESWFYRAALENSLSLDDPDEDTILEAREELKFWADLLANSGKDEMAEDLRAIAERGCLESKKIEAVEISEEEVVAEALEILEDCFPDEDFGEEIKEAATGGSIDCDFQGGFITEEEYEEKVKEFLGESYLEATIPWAVTLE